MAVVWLVVRLLQKSFMHGRTEGRERDDEPNSDVYGVLLISASAQALVDNVRLQL